MSSRHSLLSNPGSRYPYEIEYDLSCLPKEPPESLASLKGDEAAACVVLQFDLPFTYEPRTWDSPGGGYFDAPRHLRGVVEWAAPTALDDGHRECRELTKAEADALAEMLDDDMVDEAMRTMQDAYYEGDDI